MSLTQILSYSAAQRQELGLVHTPAEIAQQPESFADTFARVVARAPEVERAFRHVDAVRGGRAQLLLLGAGTSHFVGESVASALRLGWGCPVEAIPTTDLVTHHEELLLAGTPYVSISFSRSGNSPESVAALELLMRREPAVPQLVVTCNAQGAMAAQAASAHALSLVLSDAVNDRGLAMTSSFSNMAIAGLTLAHLRRLDEFEATLPRIQRACASLLELADALCERLAAEGCERCCFLGSGTLSGVARESALKVTELSGGLVTAFSESFLGVRHGPLSAVDERTLLVALLSSEPRVRRLELDLLREVRAKKLTSRVVACSPCAEPELGELTDAVLTPAEALPDRLRAPVDVVFAQLLGMYLAIAHGLAPDSPSPGGVIQRVVSGVTLYT